MYPSVYSNLASMGVEFACLIHGLSFPFTPFFDDPFDGCFLPLSGADMDELEAVERSRDSASSATDDALPNDDMVVTDARLDEFLRGWIPLGKDNAVRLDEQEDTGLG